MADVIVLMILHYHKHNKTPVWAHNHDLFDEYKNWMTYHRIIILYTHDGWQKDNYTNI